MMLLCFSKCSWLCMLQQKGDKIKGLGIWKKAIRTHFHILTCDALSLMALSLPLHSFLFVPELWISGTHTQHTHTHTRTPIMTHRLTDTHTYTHTHLFSVTKLLKNQIMLRASYYLSKEMSFECLQTIIGVKEREGETWEF